MIFIKTFLESLKLPNKQALFRLNRVGMDIVVIYMFILILLASVPSLVSQIEANSVSDMNMNVFFLLIYFFIFYYLPVTVFIFGLLSLVACAGVGIANLLKRKLRFAILWKMTAFTSTIPLILFTILTFFLDIPTYFFWIAIIYILIMLIRMITIYPKRVQK